MKILEASSIIRRILYDLIIPLAVGFVLVAIGMYFVLQSAPLVQGVLTETARGQQVEIATNHQIFKDVLQTVLAVAALGIAAFGYGTYKILSSQIEERVRRNADLQYRLTMAYHKSSLAFIYWRLYENAEPKSQTAAIYLDVAISHTRWAYDEHVVDLNQDNPKVEQLICEIRNNLTYYISERHANFGPISLEERAESLTFVNWLEERIGKYPEQAYAFQDTIDTVRERFKTTGH